MTTCDYCQHVEMCGWRKELEEQGCNFFDDGDKWIPVSERLPEGDDDVLVTLWWGYGKPEVWISDYAEVKRGAKHGQSMDEKILAHITAWQPLPEPYREDGEDE